MRNEAMKQMNHGFVSSCASFEAASFAAVSVFVAVIALAVAILCVPVIIGSAILIVLFGGVKLHTERTQCGRKLCVG